MMRAMLLLLAAGCAPARDLPPSGPALYFFIGPECPVSNFYAPEIERLSRRGVTAALVYSEPGLSEDAVSRHASEYRLSVRRVLDSDQSLARRFAVARIPTSVLVDADGRVAYRGRIDDRYSPEGKRRADPRTRDLEEALAAVAAGRDPAVKETPVFGCPLVFKEAAK